MENREKSEADAARAFDGLVGTGDRASHARRPVAVPGAERGDAGDDGTGRWSGTVVLIVIAASALVAVGATGMGLLRPAADLGDGWVRAVRIAGAAAVVAGLAGLLVQRGRLRSDRGRGRDPTGSALLTAAKIMGVLVLVALVMPRASVENDAGPETSTAAGAVTDSDVPPTSAQPPPPSPPPPGEGDRPADDRDDLRPADPDGRIPSQADGDGPAADDAGFDWSRLRRVGSIMLPLLLLGGLAVGLLALTGRLGRRRQELPPDGDPPVAADDAEPASRPAWGDVAHDSGDPRRRIAGAYHRLLAALTAAGASREPQEAPHEHLHRALGPLGVRPEPMHRLTELYVAAQFSERPITERHGAAAGEALAASLAALRATSGSPGADATDGYAADAVPAEADA